MLKTTAQSRVRPLFRAAALMVAAMVPALPGAHDGHHGPDVLARVLSTERTSNQIAISLELTGLGGPIVLTGASTPGATSAPITPIYINFAEDATVSMRLMFDTSIPAVFTLTLTFGPLGEARIEIVP